MADSARNFPEPKSPADEIALAAAELLDRDIYGPVTKTHLNVRGAKIRIDKGPGGIFIETGFDGDGGHYVEAEPAREFREILWAAWCSSVARRKAILLAPFQESLADDTFEAKQEAERTRAIERSQAMARRERYRENLIVAAVYAVGLTVLTLIGLGIRSSMSDRAAEAQVNAFGFSKTDFPASRQWEYPDECFPDDDRFSGLPDCKATLAKWESEGRVWVDWPEEGRP